LAQDPALAVLWANELTEGKNRMALLQGVAVEKLNTDPSAAFALADQFSGAENGNSSTQSLGPGQERIPMRPLVGRNRFPTRRTRRSHPGNSAVAPVGIGTQVSMQDGYPIIGGLLPGTPAALSGQIIGDRIIGSHR